MNEPHAATSATRATRRTIYDRNPLPWQLHAAKRRALLRRRRHLALLRKIGIVGAFAISFGSVTIPATPYGAVLTGIARAVPERAWEVGHASLRSGHILLSGLAPVASTNAPVAFGATENDGMAIATAKRTTSPPTSVPTAIPPTATTVPPAIPPTATIVPTAIPPTATIVPTAVLRAAVAPTGTPPPNQGVHLAIATDREVTRVRIASTPRQDAGLLEAITQALPPDTTDVAVAVMHLESGASAGLHDDRVTIPASLYKLGVLAEAFRQIEAGQLRTSEDLRLLPVDWAPGAGVLQGRIGSRITVGEALRLMIGISDNIAAHAIVRRIGPERVNANNARLGLTVTNYYTDDRPDTTSAADMARLLTLLATGRLAGPEATAEMLALLQQPQPNAWLTKGVPPEIAVAHKSGQLNSIRNDAGIVYGPTGPYVVVVLTDNRSNATQGENAIVAVTRSVYAYFAAGG